MVRGVTVERQAPTPAQNPPSTRTGGGVDGCGRGAGDELGSVKVGRVGVSEGNVVGGGGEGAAHASCPRHHHLQHKTHINTHRNTFITLTM